jgi:hypothetical protein
MKQDNAEYTQPGEKFTMLSCKRKHGKSEGLNECQTFTSPATR